MAAFISLLSEVHCVPFIPCSFTTGFDGIVSIAVSTMPALVEAVKTEKPYFLPRFEKIDWRNLFGIPIPEVDIEVNRPSDSDSGASSMSTVPVEKSNNLAAIDETNSSESSPNTSGSTSL